MYSKPTRSLTGTQVDVVGATIATGSAPTNSFGELWNDNTDSKANRRGGVMDKKQINERRKNTIRELILNDTDEIRWKKSASKRYKKDIKKAEQRISDLKNLLRDLEGE